MSSIIFHTEPEIALIATDTLAVDVTGAPFQFTSKAIIIPHLQLLVAGTGIAGFGTKWAAHINDRMIVRGIDHLNYHATSGLQRLFASYSKEVGLPENITTTIYHFGISEESGAIHSYAYRSENNFTPEQLGYGMRYKPECIAPEDAELPTDIVGMMESQREIQSKMPEESRLYIGGEIYVTEIRQSGFLTYRLHKFDDFELDEKSMYVNHANNHNS